MKLQQSGSCTTCGRGTCFPSAMFVWITNRVLTVMQVHDSSHHVCCLCGGWVHLFKIRCEGMWHKSRNSCTWCLLKLFQWLHVAMRVDVFIYLLPLSSCWSNCWGVYEGGKRGNDRPGHSTDQWRRSRISCWWKILRGAGPQGFWQTM